MKRRFVIAITAVIALVAVLLSGCEQKDTVMEDNTLKEDNTIRWVTSNLTQIPQSNIDEVNRILKKKGVDYEIKMVYLADEDYVNNVKTYLEDDDADIVWCGFLTDGICEPAELVDSDLLYKLDDMLKTENGKVITDYYPEESWKSVRYNDGYYYIQNTRVGSSEQYYVEFNPDYVSEEVFKNFDGTIQGLSDIQKKTGKMIAMDNIRLEQVDAFSGCSNYYGCLISDTDGKADIKYYDKVYDYMKIMNEMYYDGVLAYNDPQDGLSVDVNDCAAYLRFGYVEKNNWPYVYQYGGDSVLNLSSASIGIYKNSSKKEAALKVLGMVLTDKETADAFLYGVKDLDYKLDNGVISFLDEESQLTYVRELTHAGYAAADKTDSDGFDGSRYEELTKFWKSLDDEPYIGFYFDSSQCSEEFAKIVEIYNSGFPNVRNPELKKSIDAYVKRLKDAGVDTVYDQMNAQLADFKG